MTKDIEENDPTQGAAPMGIPLRTYAEVRAHLAEGGRTLGEVLAALSVERGAFDVAEVVWQRAFAEESLEGGDAIAEAFATAFAATQDELRAVPELSPEAWAELSHEQARGDGVASLSARGLTPADYARLGRHWARILARGGATTDRYFTAFYALSRAR